MKYYISKVTDRDSFPTRKEFAEYEKLKSELYNLSVSCSEIKLFADGLGYVVSIAIIVSGVYMHKILFDKYIPTYGGVLAIMIFIMPISYVVAPVLLRIKIYRARVKLNKWHEKHS